MQDYPGAARAQEALKANYSPRMRRLDRLEKYVEGTQYEWRTHFWDDEVPLYERAPCIVYPIVESAIRSNVDLCLGEGRWPSITSNAEEDDAVFDPRFGLSDDDSETVDRFIQGAAEQSRLKAKARELLAAAQGCGTAVAVLGIRCGKLYIDTVHAKWCTGTFSPSNTDELDALEIRYPYLEEYQDARTHAWDVRCMIYRRVIDAVSDTTFLPVEAATNGAEPKPGDWVADPTKTVAHNLGFCPVRWYKFLPRCSTVATCDGEAVHTHLTDELDALNFGLSQKHVAAMLASTPPVIEIGVDKDYNPAPLGRTANIVIASDFGGGGSNWMARGTGPSKTARKRGPGSIWRYEAGRDRVEVSQLTMAGDALQAIENDCRDIRAKLAEALAVVFTDPDSQTQSADISGRALREHHKRQTERCDVIRDDFGDNCLIPIINMLLRIVVVTGGKGLWLAGVDKAVPILSRFMQAVDAVEESGESAAFQAAEDESVEWFSPMLRLGWGEYFKLTGLDQLNDINATKAAYDAGFVTKRTAVEEMTDFFSIGNVDEYLAALEQEAADRQQKAMETATEMASVTGAHEPPAATATSDDG